MKDAEGTEQSQLLLRGMGAISRCKSIYEVAEQSIETIKALLHADAGSLLLVDDQKGSFKDISPSEYGEHVPLPVRKRVGAWVLEQQEGYYTKRFEDYDHRQFYESEIQSVLALPLMTSGKKILGIMQAFTFTDREPFNEEGMALVKILARYVSQVIESRQQMDRLHADLKEKELLMTEIHHRLKNNLSTITSLIDIDLPDLMDRKSIDILQRTSARLKSLTEVHSLLYQIGMADHIDLGTYFHNLSDKIAKTLLNDAKSVAINIESDPITLDAERAMTCGLILNELIINAYKHAFSYMQGGQITIRATEDEDHTIHIVVSDNGQGISDNFSIDQKTSMGCWVINALADRLNASTDISSENGTSYSLHFAR